MDVWKIDWDKRIIFLSHKMKNKDLVSLFTVLTGDELERMLRDGPFAEWTIIVTEKLN